MKKSWHVQGLGSNIKCCAFTYRVQNWGELPGFNSYGCLVTKDWWNTCGSLVSFGNGAGEGGLTDRKYVVFLLRPFLHGLLSFFNPVQQDSSSLHSFLLIFSLLFLHVFFFPGLSSLLFTTIPCPLFLSFSSFSGIYSDILFWHPLWHLFWHFLWNSILLLSDDLSGIYSDILSGISSGILSGILSDRLFCHSIWHLFWHSILPFYLAFILALFFGHPIWHSILPSIWHSFWHCFWQILWHPIWHSFWHLFWHFIFHSIWHPFRHSFWDSIWHLFPPDLAVEIRHCPLCSGVRSWSPEVPAEIWSSQLAGRRKKKKKEEQVTLRKSRDSHLAGGEKDRSTPKSTKQADPTLAQMWERFAW